MALKGDLSTIGLAEVFQMISMSQKQGTLVVQDSDSRKCIYFGETGVKLLSTGKRKGMRLGDMLLRAGKLSEMALQDALENAKIQKKLLGEILVENGIVADQEIQDVVRSQIEEEIYDLFVWKKAAFEFIEGPPSDALRDPEAPVTQLSFDVNGLLLEAVRRADEWNIINEKIPSADSIFTFVSESDRVEEDKTASDQIKRVYRLIDGQTSVTDVVDGTGISRFEVCKALLDLIGRGRVRILTVHEVMDVAVKRMADGHRDRAIRLYQAAAAQAPKDPKIVVGVAKLLEGEGLGKEAAGHYARAGRLSLEQGDAARALEYLQKAQSLNADDIEVRLALFEVHAATGNLADGKKLAQELIVQAMMAPDYPRARMLVDRILAADPSDLGFRTHRAKILYRTGQKKDLEEELALIRKSMPADPTQAEKILRDLKEVMGPPSGVKRPTAAVRPAASPARKAGGGKGKAVAVVIVLLLLTVAGFAGKYELDARKDLEARVEESRKMAGQEQFSDARKILEGFLTGPFRFSPFQKEKIPPLLAQIDEQRRNHARDMDLKKQKHREEVTRTLEEFWKDVETARIQSTSSALKKVEAIRDLADKEGFADHVGRAEEVAKVLRARNREADDLRQKGEKLEETGKFREAAQAYDRIIREYSNTDAVMGLQYPLAIRSHPADVTVSNAKNGLLLGKTAEGVFKMRLRPAEPVRLRFQKDGYQDVEKDVPDKTIGELFVELTEKRDLWMIPLGVRIEREPCLGGDTIYMGASNKVYAVAAAKDKEILWPVPESVEGNVEGTPRFANNLLYVGTASGVCALDPAKLQGRRLVWRYGSGERVIGGVSVSPDGAVVYVGTAGRMLHAVNARDGQPLWKRELPAECSVEPAFIPGAVVVACQNGLLLAVKGPGPSDEVWRFQAGGPLGPMLSDKDGIFAAGGDQMVYAVRPDGQPLWKRPLAGATSTRPARLSDVLYAASRDGKVHFLSAVSGEVLGRFEAEGAILGGVTVEGALVFFGSDDGYLYCFEPVAQKMRWRCKSNGNIRVAPVARDGRVYFASGDVMYAAATD
jgi:outer membrane protein assembly factor BamB/tetratricopeptide (TPR) repeat protein